MKEKIIYFIRHGETELNRNKIVQGQGVDAPLNELGKRQARAFFDFYKDEGFDAVLTSALIRTQQTVAPFIDKGLPSESFSEINEINWGIHEGRKSEPWMIEAYNRLIEQWKAGNYNARLQEGESAEEMAYRLSVFLDQLKARTEEKILVCSHGRAMRCLMCLIRDQHLGEMEKYHHSNTGLYKAHFRGGQFDLLLENDVQHLVAAALGHQKWI